MNDERIVAEALANKPLFKRKDVALRYEVDLRTVDRWQHDLLKPTHSDKRGPRWTLRDLIIFEIQRLPLLKKETEEDTRQMTLLPNG